MDVTTKGGDADVSFSARVSGEWRGTPSFESFDEVSEFFRKGNCGFSCALRGDELEGLQLKTLQWSMVPLRQALEVWDAATPGEKQTLRMMLLQKRARYLKSSPPAERNEDAVYQRLLGMRVNPAAHIAP